MTCRELVGRLGRLLRSGYAESRSHASAGQKEIKISTGRPPDLNHPSIPKIPRPAAARADIQRARGSRPLHRRSAADRPNALFCRDLVLMTPEGAIVTRPAMEARRVKNDMPQRSWQNWVCLSYGPSAAAPPLKAPWACGLTAAPQLPPCAYQPRGSRNGGTGIETHGRNGNFICRFLTATLIDRCL